MKTMQRQFDKHVKQVHMQKTDEQPSEGERPGS